MRAKLLFIALFIPLCFSCMKLDIKVADLSDQEIINLNSASKMGYITQTVNTKFAIKVRSFSGGDKLKTFEASDKQIDLTLSNSLEKGELKIVLCDSEKIIHEFEINKENQTFTIPPSNQKVYLKVVGNKARYTLTYNYEINEPAIPVLKGTSL